MFSSDGAYVYGPPLSIFLYVLTYGTVLSVIE